MKDHIPYLVDTSHVQPDRIHKPEKAWLVKIDGYWRVRIQILGSVFIHPKRFADIYRAAGFLGLTLAEGAVV
jgi:hypothetical protein